MLRDETVALFLEGREAWNAWAEAVLGGRSALEAAGRWAAKRNSSGHLEPENAETEAWMKSATATFSFCIFHANGAGQANGAGNGERGSKPSLPAGKPVHLNGGCIDFGGFVFPGDVWFDNAAFSGDTSFTSAAFLGSARFDNAAFLGSTWFNGAMFQGYSRFNAASFAGNVWLDSAAFAGSARFDGTAFAGNTLFGSAKFASSAGFRDAKFLGYTSFASVTFSGSVRFFEAAFSGGAWFSGTAFKKRADFEGAQFTKRAVFDGIEAEHAFNLTGAAFAQVPVFSQAEFQQAPDLGGMRFPLPGFWNAGNADLIAQYRALRHMAAGKADYERAHLAFKGELRSRRWTTDKWWHPGLWLGLFYDAIADCGRSIVRPLALWGTSVFVFALAYLKIASLSAGAWHNCLASGGDPFGRALVLSGRNALLLFGGGSDPRIVQAYQCLFPGTPAEPRIPNAVTLIEIFVQVPLSAALIFLVLLAVRNRFKIT